MGEGFSLARTTFGRFFLWFQYIKNTKTNNNYSFTPIL